MTNNDMEKKKVIAVDFEQKRAVSFTPDMNVLCKYQTESAVKKALEKMILDSKVFQEKDLSKLKYQGRKEIIDEWKTLRQDMVEQDTAIEQALLAEANDYRCDYNLNRFLTAQEYRYPMALEEIRNGRKKEHWIWYIFPQKKGLGHSHNSEFYGLNGIEEAKAYVQHPVLGYRLRKICNALLEHRGKNIHYIMGSNVDVMKLRSSMEIFDLASPNDVFEKVLKAFY